MKHGPGALEKFMFANYPALWEKVDRKANPTKYNAPSDVDRILAGLPEDVKTDQYKQMAAVHRDDCDAEVVQWIMDHDRPRNMMQDVGLHHVMRKVQVLPGLYTLPDDQRLVRGCARQGGRGVDAAREWILKSKAEGRRISIAGDIWTDGDLSFLAIVGYVIFDGWIWSRQVLAVVEFSKVKHTASQIKKQTIAALKGIGLEDAFEEVWRKVSDAGSNMKKGWNGFDGGNQTCADHKIERSTRIYSLEPEIAEMSKQRHDAARHLNVSTRSSNDVIESHDIFDSESKSTKATRSGETRWRSHHAESRWFRQHATELADAKHNSGNEALESRLLDEHQQRLNDEEESSMAVAAQVSLGLEPDTQPTISLVLPYLDAIMYDMKPSRPVSMATGGTRRPEDLLPASRKAREATFLDFKERWVDGIDEEYEATLLVATYCDPRHKEFKLRSYSRGDLAALKRKAHKYAKALYEMEYGRPDVDAEPTRDEADSEPDEPVASPMVAAQLKKAICVDAASFLGREGEREESSDEDSEVSEWEKYMNLPQAALSKGLLEWWREHEHEFPNIARMAKQVLGCPACSSGVERLFSKAGRNHSKLQCSLKEASMKNIMFAYNVSRLLNVPPK